MNEKQSSKADQQLIIVDSEDRVLGFRSREDCHEGEGILHRAFSIFIFNGKKELLLQKRSGEKALWPLHWSNSVCSHPRKGESYGDAARRRLIEEMGLQVPLKFLFKFQYQARFRDMGSENELCSVFIGKSNGAVRANKSEVAEWKYIALPDLNVDLSENSGEYTPWFKMEWIQIQKNHSREIEGLSLD
jgi:isopentenyl-diphosphate Delta-isomerase